MHFWTPSTGGVPSYKGDINEGQNRVSCGTRPRFDGITRRRGSGKGPEREDRNHHYHNGKEGQEGLPPQRLVDSQGQARRGRGRPAVVHDGREPDQQAREGLPVSYTHLTLPTI